LRPNDESGFLGNRGTGPESKRMKAAGGRAREEAKLLAMARAGSGEAFDELVGLHADRVYALLVRLTGSPEDAEDLAQECFLRAYRSLGSFRGGSAFYTWLYRIAVNLARSGGRSKQRRREVEVPMVAVVGRRADGDDGDADARIEAAVQETPEDLVQRREMLGRVQEALAELSDDHREVVVLRDIEGLDYEQIGQLVGATREAVKSRLHRARGELAARLKGLGYVGL
jgi:RNA polymerase sigma-70 factor (ECF subfamily)